MKDQYQRTIDYIRISVTDRCNFRCRYCMPEEGVESICHTEIMTYEEILRLVRLAAGLGIKKVKITGGEPLVRRGVCGLIGEISRMPGIESVTITTNGALLEQYLTELVQAGVTGINISLDTLNRERFRYITRRDDYDKVQAGLKQAVATGIPTKINCVPMRGFNEDELADIAALAKHDPVAVRFIEMMPIGMGVEKAGIYQDEIRKGLESRYGTMLPIEEMLGNGPAKYYQIPGFQGKIGFISAISHEFCEGCNRVRLTADGILKPCLNYESHINLKQEMRNGIDDWELEKILKDAIYAKPRCHSFGDQTKKEIQEKRKMAGIGG
ncbi:GTP 3',8-cyclase MoaA [Bariatricus sp. SGI.154]|uniref:GTP 3',8-cyclase MoaA n=1 Tax=Bariatricus sp. SGI.154 TaxID=3420549 RepID=UPI003D071D7D